MTDFLPRILVLAIVCASLVAGGAIAMHRHDKVVIDALRTEFSVFKGGVEALGKAAEKRAREIDAQNAKRKEDADKENAATVARLNRTIAGLRRAADSARPSSLPVAPPDSSRPDLLCLDRAEYQREDGILTQRLLQGARGLADEGTKATIDLDTGKDWAKNR